MNKELDNCPHCGVSLNGDPIPEDIRKHYGAEATHWRREIGVEDPEKYDGVYYWECPDCEGQWGGYRSLRDDT